jgi:hypothetical protein
VLASEAASENAGESPAAHEVENMPPLDDILPAILEIAPGLHGLGAFSARALVATARHARTREIRHSAETGSGASTLLCSHLSRRHTVFALDGGSGSVANVRRSALLRPGVVTFVEGPTQLTLPRHRFEEKLQLVLIDGPHGYPFPDLEYYYLYPHLAPGALLILDDIHIRTVHNLFRFLRADAMFRLDEVAGTTAFFTRTEAPAFDPLGDGWNRQNYNARPLLRYAWKQRVGSLAPEPARRAGLRLQRGMAARAGAASVTILAPRSGEVVGAAGVVEGTATLPADGCLWVLVHRRDVAGWWPQGPGPALLDGAKWSVPVRYGDPGDAGREFEIAALIVRQPTHDLWLDWVARLRESGAFPPVQLPPAGFVLGEARRTVKKAPA